MTDHGSVEPPAGLEERVVGTLRSQGLLRASEVRVGRRLAPRWSWPVALAAGLLLFVGGFALGRRPVSTSAPDLSRYTLLLFEGPGFNPGMSGEADLVREYSEWAGDLAARGRLVAGEKLAAAAWTLGPEVASWSGGPTGFFVIAARDQDEALAIARTCPHLKHGGTVSVRPIEPT
jgi:hypothetical protein